MLKINSMSIEQEYNKLPATVKDRFESKWAGHPSVISLQTRIADAQQKKNYPLALQLSKELESRKLKAKEILLADAEAEVRRVNILELGMPREDVDKVNYLTIAMYMCCDMIDWIDLQVNSTIRKHAPDNEFHMFDDIIKAGKAAKDRLKYLSENTTLLKDGKFYDRSDNMYEMVINKAKKLYRQFVERKAKEIHETGKTEI